MIRKHLYLAPEPGDTAGTDTGADPVETPSIPATEPPPSTVTEPDASLANDQTPEPSKIGDLLDNIGKDETPEAPKPEAKQPDPTAPVPKPPEKADPDLTAPEGISDRAKTRWTNLAERAKQVPVLEQRATEAEGQLNSIRQVVQQSGLDPIEFGNALEMGRLFKSSDPTDLKNALDQIDALRLDVASRLGVDVPGVDVLAKHPDLAAEVEAMTISRERAIEFAKLRDSQAKADAIQQTSAETQQTIASFETAAKSMDAAIALRSATPGHAEKVAFIHKQLSDPARVQQFVTTYRPEQWQSVVMMMYDAYTPPAAPAAPAVPQPLRPGHVTNGVRQLGNKPVSAEAAVENAWGAVGL